MCPLLPPPTARLQTFGSGWKDRSEARNTLMSQVKHSAQVLSTPDPGWGVSVGTYRRGPETSVNEL